MDEAKTLTTREEAEAYLRDNYHPDGRRIPPTTQVIPRGTIRRDGLTKKLAWLFEVDAQLIEVSDLCDIRTHMEGHLDELATEMDDPTTLDGFNQDTTEDNPALAPTEADLVRTTNEAFLEGIHPDLQPPAA